MRLKSPLPVNVAPRRVWTIELSGGLRKRGEIAWVNGRRRSKEGAQVEGLRAADARFREGMRHAARWHARANLMNDCTCPESACAVAGGEARCKHFKRWPAALRVWPRIPRPEEALVMVRRLVRHGGEADDGGTEEGAICDDARLDRPRG